MKKSTHRPTASEIDGVAYRRAKLWEIILVSCNGMIGMSVYSLIGMASYSASIGYGISTAIIGVILMGTRILDGVTDPLLALLYDKVDTRFGRLRILLISGFLIEGFALYGMFDLFSSKGFGIFAFTLLYVLYVIGYTIANMTAQTFFPILTNDPKQRPTLGVWSTIFNYFVPMAMSILLNVILLPRCGGTYNQQFLSLAVRVTLLIAAVGVVLVCIGITPIDKPAYYKVVEKKEPLKIRDMIDVVAHNKPLQAYIISAASDKFAVQSTSQSIIGTLLYGIVIGNIGLSTILSIISMVPSILFAAFGARYAGKHGNRDTIRHFSFVCIMIAAISIVFFVVIDPKSIATFGPTMVIYVILNLLMNGSRMCITTANTAFMADITDYELDRSGRYVPAVTAGTYSLIDKIISSFGAVMATGAVALLGYHDTVPQPTDPSTPAIFAMAMALFYGLPIIGWAITLLAMKNCKLGKEEMVEVQKHIEAKKKAAQAQTA